MRNAAVAAASFLYYRCNFVVFVLLDDMTSN